MRDVRDMVDLAKEKTVFKKRLFCIDDTSYIDVNFISAWLSHADVDKYEDQTRKRIELFQTQAQCIICDTIFGKNVTPNDLIMSTMDELKRQNLEILALLNSVRQAQAITVEVKPVPAVITDNVVDIPAEPKFKGKMPKPIAPEVAWMRSVTAQIEDRIKELNMEISVRKVLHDIYKYMTTNYGFVADQVRKELREDADSRRMSTLEAIAYSETWKDIFEGILLDYLVNMAEKKSAMSQAYEARVNEMVELVAKKIGDNTPNKSKAYIKIYDEMYTPQSWKMRVGRWCHGNVPRNFTKRTMILGSQAYAERFVEAATAILNREVTA